MSCLTIYFQFPDQPGSGELVRDRKAIYRTNAVPSLPLPMGCDCSRPSETQRQRQRESVVTAIAKGFQIELIDGKIAVKCVVALLHLGVEVGD